MPKSSFAGFAVLAFLLCSVVAANEATRRIRTAQDKDSKERFLDVVPWTRPKYWNAYSNVFTRTRLKRCAARNGVPPANGSSCQTLATGWYSCLFGETKCRPRPGRLPGRGGLVGKQFSGVKVHPTIRCDCLSGRWTCHDWKICAKPQICGSRGLPPCPDGQTCIDPDPSDSCDPAADCPGICAPNTNVCPNEPVVSGTMPCSTKLSCNYEQPLCCGQVIDPIVCECNVGGAFECSITPLCLDLSCNTTCVVTKTTWPELVGTMGKRAQKVIKAEQPCLTQVEIVLSGSIVTADFRTDRVRIFVDPEGVVIRAPIVG